MKDEIKEKIKAYYMGDDIDKVLNSIINLQEKNEELLKKSYSDDVIITKAVEILKDTNVDMPKTLLIETIDYARHILNSVDK